MRSAVIEIGGTTTRAVVADPAPGGGLTLRLDRRIVLRLRQAVDRDGAVGEGLRLLLVETVRRLQAECFRAGVARPHVVAAADLAGAGDLGDLLASLRRAVAGPIEVRSSLDEASLLLQDVALDGDVAVAEVGDRTARFVQRVAGAITVEHRAGPLDVARALGRRELRLDPAPALDEVRALRTCRAVVTGPVPAAVVRALWARNGRGARGPDRCEVTTAALAALERELLALTPTQRLLLPAVAPEEVDLVVLGAGYLHGLAQRWDVEAVLAVATSSAEATLRARLVDGSATTARPTMPA